MAFRSYVFFTLFLLSLLGLHGQNATDALRFSNFQVAGTGRFVGVGGSLGALGTEFSVLSTNPAGLAMYRSSELVVSPSLVLNSTDSQLDGAFFPAEPNVLLDNFDNPTINESQTAFNLSNVGFVVHSQPRSFKFKTFNFGIGLNNLANFHQTFRYNGNSVGSIVERWQEFANLYGVDPQDNRFEESLAFQVEALLYDEQEDFYFTDYDQTLDGNLIGAPLFREQTVNVEGSISELVFSLGTNYMERLMVGITVGVPILNYRVDREYIEQDENDRVPFFEDLSFEESIRTTGTGFNFKMGLIYRLSQAVRLGFAFHTPTSFSLNDESDFGIGYTYTDGGVTNSNFAESDQLIFDYRLRTPWRLFGSAGFIFKKFGFLTAEVEWVDYSNASFDFGQFQQEEADANADIEQSLGDVLNIRLGAEGAYDIFRFRGGLGILPTAFTSADEQNFTYSAGAGIRTGSFFVDLAYRHSGQSSGFIPYGTFDVPQQFVFNDMRYNTFILTLGFRY